MGAVEKATEIFLKMAKWNVNPYQCAYWNPSKYNITAFVRWAQRYCVYRQYLILSQAANMCGLEVVPAELFLRHGTRYKKRVRVGNMVFYLMTLEEMGNGLLKRYMSFLERINDKSEAD